MIEPSPLPELRVGQGYDVHRLVAGRELGGIGEGVARAGGVVDS